MLETISIKQALEEAWLGRRRGGSRVVIGRGRGSEAGEGGSGCW